MEYIVEREYYERNNELSNRLFNVRYNSDNLPLSERVKKYNAANCQEYSLLTLEILREKYPNKRLFEIMFQDDDGISDTEHVAVMIFDIADTEGNADFYKSEILNINNLSEYLKNVTIIDNWFGGVFKGDDWIKMQSEIHDSKNFNITYIERE